MVDKKKKVAKAVIAKSDMDKLMGLMEATAVGVTELMSRVTELEDGKALTRNVTADTIDPALMRPEVGDEKPLVASVSTDGKSIQALKRGAVITLDPDSQKARLIMKNTTPVLRDKFETEGIRGVVQKFAFNDSKGDPKYMVVIPGVTRPNGDGVRISEMTIG
jgi:hypothetical protein